MPTVTIPSTIEDAVSELDGLGALLTAKEWERAAIVWAFTNDGKPGPKSSAGNPAELSCTEFAKKGISGLSHRDTVAAYRKAWQDAIDSGHAKTARPGRAARLPNLDWPATSTGGGISHDVRGDADQKAGAVVKLMADPEVANKALANPAVVAAATKSKGVRTAARKADSEDWAKKARARQRRRTEYEQDFPEARRIQERGEEAVVRHELSKAVLCLNTVIKTLPDCGPMNVDVDLEDIMARVEAIRAFTTGGGVAAIEAFANEARA